MKYDNWKDRVASMEKLGIVLSSAIVNDDEVLDKPYPRGVGRAVLEEQFIEQLANVLNAWTGATNCPCCECAENFVVRARRLHRTITTRAQRHLTGEGPLVWPQEDDDES